MLLVTNTFFAQQGINYKAIITDNGAVVASQSIDLRFTILENGTSSVYQETHAVSTDANGIVVVNIGEGDYETGDWATIDWRKEQFLKVEVDTGGGFTDMGTSAFKTVPHAKAADKLLPTDRVVIGDNSMNHGERLFIQAPTVESSELVDFTVDSPVQNDDIINLKFGAAPTSGNAQFIEANLGGTTTFKVNHTGAIYTTGGIDTYNDINIFGGDLNASNNINVSQDLAITGDLAVTGNVTTHLDMGNHEIHGAASGDADMKAYMYGTFAVGQDGYVSYTSDEFTVTRTAFGKYRVEFNDSNIEIGGLTLLVSVTKSDNDDTPTLVNGLRGGWNDNYFYIYQYDLNGNPYEGDPNTGYDAEINFVLYKK